MAPPRSPTAGPPVPRAGCAAVSPVLLPLDESGQEKKGTATVGVKRQYVGCAGRISNAINVVYCSFAVRAGHALVGARPYLPREWATDPDRRARARVPQEITFATKPELGRQILADLHAEGRLPPWVTGDEVYGADPNLRAWLESVQPVTSSPSPSRPRSVSLEPARSGPMRR